jgi:hypothetical protein
MDFDNFFEPEVGIAAVVAAAIFSPRARKAIRRGLVYGTAGVLIAGDAITSFSKNVSQNMQQMQTHNQANGHHQETQPAATLEPEPEPEKAKSRNKVVR